MAWIRWLAVAIAAAVPAGCVPSSERPAIEACRQVDKEIIQHKLGINLKEAIELALATSSTSAPEGTSDDPACPGLLAVELAENVEASLPVAPKGITTSRIGRRIYYSGIRPANGSPASPETLGLICAIAASHAVERVDFYRGISSEPKSGSWAQKGANDVWMNAIGEPYLGAPPSTRSVAILDTAIVPQHEDLPEIHRFRAARLIGEDGTCGDAGCCVGVEEGSTREWHATAVAGTIAAKRDPPCQGVDGLSRPRSLIAVDIASDVENCTVLQTIAAGMQCAMDQGASVINFSMRGAEGALAPELKHVLDAAAANDVLVVAAAGNDVNNLDSTSYWPAAYETDTSLTVTVGGVDPGSWGRNGYGSHAVDLAVPIRDSQVETTSETGGYATYGRTSAAAAIVSGTALSLWSRPEYAHCHAADIKKILLDHALPPPPEESQMISPHGGILSFRFLADSTRPAPDACASAAISAARDAER